jgi:hypothetical protein
MAQRLKIEPSDRLEPSAVGRSRWLLGFAAFGAPGAWSAQFIAGAAIASYPCIPDGTLYVTAPLEEPSARTLLLAVNVVATFVALLALYTAWLAWKGSRQDDPPSPEAILAERLSRTRYLAAWGLMNGCGFLIAILFDTVMVLGVPARC